MGDSEVLKLDKLVWYQLDYTYLRSIIYQSPMHATIKIRRTITNYIIEAQYSASVNIFTSSTDSKRVSTHRMELRYEVRCA